MTTVKLFDVEADVHPSGLCALLIPHADSEKDLTTQQSLDKLPMHQLALFASVQVVEWGIDDGSAWKDDGATERMRAIQSRNHRTVQECAWREIFVKSQERRRGACRKATR